MFERLNQHDLAITFRPQLVEMDTDSTLATLSTYQLSPYDKEVYETQLKGLVSYNWIFEKKQGILKQDVLILLMHLKDDFDMISASLSQTP